MSGDRARWNWFLGLGVRGLVIDFLFGVLILVNGTAPPTHGSASGIFLPQL
jgi:hypothetical protein